MGKKKIPMEYIEDPRKRKLCFDKRQIGLLKKAMELCKLAHAEVGLIIIAEDDNALVEFWSGEKTELVHRYQQLSPAPHYDFTLSDYQKEISTQLALKPYPVAAAEEFARGLRLSAENERSSLEPARKRPRWMESQASPVSTAPTSQPTTPEGPVQNTWASEAEVAPCNKQLSADYFQMALGQLCDEMFTTPIPGCGGYDGDSNTQNNSTFGQSSSSNDVDILDLGKDVSVCDTLSETSDSSESVVVNEGSTGDMSALVRACLHAITKSTTGTGSFGAANLTAAQEPISPSTAGSVSTSSSVDGGFTVGDMLGDWDQPFGGGGWRGGFCCTV